MDRRHFIASGLSVGLAACGGGGSASPASERIEDHGRKPSGQVQPALSPPASPKARVIVVGGGMAGATAAKYLRMWGDAIDVTLVERSPTYTACILSSLVLTGQRTLASLGFGYDTLRTRWGVRTVFGEVVGIDAANASVRLASGATLSADRIVLAPGIDFEPVAGLTQPDRMPHAWKAGAQTTLLAQQLAAMPASGTVVVTVPPAPYRCPPGPYERSCLLADWLRVHKPRARIVVLDANPDIVAERDNFARAFSQLYPGIVEYRPNQRIDHVDEASRTLFLVNAATGGVEPAVRGDVVNLIPGQRAPALLRSAGLANAAGGRFAGVDVLNYASTVAGAARVHVLGDSIATTQPKSGHIANQEAKVCADALVRAFGGLAPDPAPVTSSACFSTITMTQASWLHGMFQYDPGMRVMAGVAAGSGASAGWSTDHFQDMQIWFRSLMSDTFS